MTTLPRPPSILDSDFPMQPTDGDTPSPADVGFAMTFQEPVEEGKLLGIVAAGRLAYTGRNDPHVLVVRELLRAAKRDALAGNLQKVPLSYNRGPVEGWAYTLNMRWQTHPVYAPDAWSQGARSSYDIEIQRFSQRQGRQRV